MYQKLIAYLTIMVIAVIFLPAEAFSDAEEEFHQTYSVENGIQVEFENRNGEVSISSWNKDYVDVYAMKYTEGNQEDLDCASIVVNNDGVLEIQTVFKNYSGEESSFFNRLFSILKRRRDVTVDYTIKLPETLFLRKAQIRNGSIEINGIHGETTVNSRNGSIVLLNVEKCTEAEARNGSITISGDTEIGKLQSRNGNISADIPEIVMENIYITTRNGSVDLYLADNLNADVEMKTRDGKISGETVKLKLKQASDYYFLGTLGSGGKAISVTTRNGNVTLHNK